MSQNGSLSEWPPPGELLPALLLLNLTGAVVACCLLALACPHHLRLVLLACLLGLDGVLSQGGGVLLAGDPALRQPACRTLALLTLLSLLLLLATLASLALFTATDFPPYLHLALPPLLAISVALPSAFPEVAPVRYFQDRYTCGFVNLAKSYATVILLIGFVFPFSVLIYFALSKSALFRCKPCHGCDFRNGRTIVLLVSLCSVLLIPHIIQINIAHFSSNLFKTKRNNETIYSGVYDTFSIWLRYEFNLFTPIIVLFAVGGLREAFRNLRESCRKRGHLMKYVNRVRAGRGPRVRADTPILFATAEGLRMVCGQKNLGADPPELDPPVDRSSTSRGESSVSTTATDSSKTSRERRNPAGKKIVRFAHSVKEISWKDTNKWESSKGSSVERF